MQAETLIYIPMLSPTKATIITDIVNKIGEVGLRVDCDRVV
ncbi:MAG: hypothetical protein ACK6CP_23275 [Pseudanabaena sp.]